MSEWTFRHHTYYLIHGELEVTPFTAWTSEQV